VVRITFTVEGAGVGVNIVGRLFAAVYARNLDRAIPASRPCCDHPTRKDPGRAVRRYRR
jgi:hypothetical protein